MCKYYRRSWTFARILLLFLFFKLKFKILLLKLIIFRHFYMLFLDMTWNQNMWISSLPQRSYSPAVTKRPLKMCSHGWNGFVKQSTLRRRVRKLNVMENRLNCSKDENFNLMRCPEISLLMPVTMFHWRRHVCYCNLNSFLLTNKP